MKRVISLMSVMAFVFILTNIAFAKNFKILVVDSQDAEPYITLRGAMLKRLTEAGYVQGKNLEVTYYSLAHHVGRAQSIMLREADKEHDVIFVNGTMATIAFKEQVLGNSKFRVVFCAVTDPVDVGVIEDFVNPPKYNFTGVSYPIPIRKRFEFIRQLMPQAKNVGYIYADMPQSHSYMKWIDNFLNNDQEFKDFKALKRQVDFIPADKGSERMAVLAIPAIKDLNSQVDLFMSPSDQLGTQQPFARTVYENATKPLLGIGGKDVLDGWGATMSIFTSLDDMGRQAADLIIRLLQGTDLKQIIPEQPKDLSYAFDMKKAKQFGINIPPNLLELAGDNVIQ